MTMPYSTPPCPGLEIAPILRAAPRPARGLPIGLCLASGMTLALALAYSALLAGAGPKPGMAFAPRRVVSVALLEEPIGDPTRPIGPGQEAEPPGLGHVLGTNTIDAALLNVPTVLNSRDLDPTESPSSESLLVTPGVPGLAADKSLPIGEGGNGLRKGTGWDVGRGGGGGRPDLKLVLIHQEPAEIQDRSTETDLKIPVVIRIFLGEDGRPIQADYVSGPIKLVADCLKAAWKWRFEPLHPHGLKAPLDVTITFHPRVRKPGSRT